jgi:hypothetical protein
VEEGVFQTRRQRLQLGKRRFRFLPLVELTLAVRICFLGEVSDILLMVVKSEIKPSTPASFQNIQSPKVVVGLNSNQFHEFC